MFKCYFCNEVTPPGTTRHSVVIETREKRYAAKRREYKGGGRGGGRFRRNDETPQDRGGAGVEIMKEVPACPACAAKDHEVKQIPLPTVAPAPAPEATEEEQS